RRAVGHPDPAVVLVGAIPAEGPEELAVGRGVGDAGDHLAAVFEADQGGPVGDVADEAAGPVDRVDDPAVAGGPWRAAELLAEKAIAGERGRQSGAQRLLGVAVGNGDRAVVGLPLDGDVAVEVTEGDLPG